LDTLTLFVIAIFAGAIGAILGLGGGIIIVPVLTLFFGVEIHTAVAASAVSVIATSTGAAVAYLKDRLTNSRIAMLLQVGTTTGALTGALVAGWLYPQYLYLLFGLLMAYSALAMYRARRTELPEGVVSDRLSKRLRLQGDYYDQSLGKMVHYEVARVLPGLGLMYASGALAGLLGIGGGSFKVLAMDQVMRLPIKVSTATSNFMIGVTAAASSAVYFVRGDVEPLIAGPVALGVLGGALIGTRVMVRLKGSTIRALFVPVLLVIAIQMIYKGVTFR
jgi:uncharacterized membrane protein YfcA